MDDVTIFGPGKECELIAATSLWKFHQLNVGFYLSVHYLKRDYCLYFYVFHDLYMCYYAMQSQKSDTLYFYLYFFLIHWAFVILFVFLLKIAIG